MSSSSSEGSEAPTPSHGRRLTHSVIRQIAPPFNVEVDLVCNYCDNPLTKKHTGHQLRCGHTFHPGCILRYLARRLFCPACEFDLTATAPNVADASPNVNPEEADEEPASADPEAADEEPKADREEADEESKADPGEADDEESDSDDKPKVRTDISEGMPCDICRKNLARRLFCPACEFDLTAAAPNVAEASPNVNPEEADEVPASADPEEADEEPKADREEADEESKADPGEADDEESDSDDKPKVRTDISEGMPCDICRKNLKSGDAGKLTCNPHCIADNIKMSSYCPLCGRRQI